MTQIVFPAFSGRAATADAATTAAPELMPTSRPSAVASSRALAMASSEDTWTTSSTRSTLRFLGTKPAPVEKKEVFLELVSVSRFFQSLFLFSSALSLSPLSKKL